MFINVNSETLAVTVNAEALGAGFDIEAKQPSMEPFAPYDVAMLRDGEPSRDELFAFIAIEDEEYLALTGRMRMAVPPDPWLVVLSAIMLEGVLQGMTWDVVKQALQQAIAKLQANDLAPKSAPVSEDYSRERYIEAGFSQGLFFRYQSNYKHKINRK